LARRWWAAQATRHTDTSSIHTKSEPQKDRSTSHREALPLLYELAGKPFPTPIPGEEYPGYPLVASGEPVLLWFLFALPILIIGAWFWSRRAPRIPRRFVQHGDQP